MSKNHDRKRSRAGECYFDKFHTKFWERPITQFDKIRNTNLEIQKRCESHINYTLPPSYEEVTAMLSHSNRGRE
ncbi:9510_t:CDS:2 [Cetraspora pellucida]|uniref:9510_t:CDS:1 n=1 Tax=Cetraspora pellucida TaxID=1433469 RepID=A0A9N9FPM7_9GLOM|nr:9510_t:CDS:2 [Cetraspora pellucida]